MADTSCTEEVFWESEQLDVMGGCSVHRFVPMFAAPLAIAQHTSPCYTLPTVASNTTYEVLRNKISLVFFKASMPNTIGDVVVSGKDFKERRFPLCTFITFKILFFQLITAR
jgi:hypothetical protein